MTWAPDYCSTSELKAHLRVSDNVDDTALGVAITAASRAIDAACGRQFGSASQTRTYAWANEWVDGRRLLTIDDIQTSVGLTVKMDTARDGTFATTLTLGTDFELWPYNAPSDGEPWIGVTFNQNAAQPCGRPNEVQVAGTLGWSAVPVIVKQACLIQAARFFTRRDSSYGVAGSPELGSEMRLLERLDPDVAIMIGAVRRWWGAV